MSTIIEGQRVVEVEEVELGKVRVRQQSEGGGEQAIDLELRQMEQLAAWFQEYVGTAREDLSPE